MVSLCYPYILQIKEGILPRRDTKIVPSLYPLYPLYFLFFLKKTFSCFLLKKKTIQKRLYKKTIQKKEGIPLLFFKIEFNNQKRYPFFFCIVFLYSLFFVNPYSLFFCCFFVIPYLFLVFFLC